MPRARQSQAAKPCSRALAVLTLTVEMKHHRRHRPCRQRGCQSFTIYPRRQRSAVTVLLPFVVSLTHCPAALQKPLQIRKWVRKKKLAQSAQSFHDDEAFFGMPRKEEEVIYAGCCCGTNTRHFFLNWLSKHIPSKISSFVFTSALDTHVRIVIPKPWRSDKVT